MHFRRLLYESTAGFWSAASPIDHAHLDAAIAGFTHACCSDGSEGVDALGELDVALLGSLDGAADEDDVLSVLAGVQPVAINPMTVRRMIGATRAARILMIRILLLSSIWFAFKPTVATVGRF